MMVLFSGFQRQPNARSIQEELEKDLLRLNSGTPVTVHGAGRTDAGVHAYGQVIHFDLPQERDPEKLRFIEIHNVQMTLMLLVLNLYQKNFMHDTINTVKPMSF